MTATRALDPLSLSLGGLHLVEASAGTGKTFAITSLYLRLVMEGGLGVDRILVVTFTRAATAELHDRIRERLWAAVSALEEGGAPDDPFLDALVRRRGDREGDRRRLLTELGRFDEASISTIHGFCGRILGDHAFESQVPFEARLATEDDSVLAQVAQDYWTRCLASADPALVRLLLVRKLGVGELITLAEKVFSAVEPALVPAPGTDGLDEALGQAQAAFDALVARWPADREVARAFARPGPALNAARWRVGSHERRLARLEALLGPGARLPFSADKDWTCFSSEAVEAATKKGFTPPRHPFFDCVSALARAIEAMSREADRRVLAIKGRFLQEARGELRRRKAEAGLLCFDDLLVLVDEALARPGGEALAKAVRGRYSAALIDEFQDTDALQYRIFRRIFTGVGTALFLIGDPKQAIYGFRGADVFAYQGAARDAGGERHTLDTNWRSDPGLIAAVNRIFSSAARPFLMDWIPFEPVSPRPGAEDALGGPVPFTSPLELIFVPAASFGSAPPPLTKGLVGACLPSVVAGEIARFLSAGVRRRGEGSEDGEALGPGDLAVLVRSNRQGAAIQAALRSVGIPSVLHSEASVFDTAEALEVILLLRAMARPAQLSRLRMALATSLVGYGAADLLALGEDEGRMEGWIEAFRRFADLHAARGFVAAFSRFLAEQEVPSRLLAMPDGERRLTNFLHLGELLHLASRRQRLGLEGLASWVSRARGGAALEGVTDRDAKQVRVESDDRAVQVLTLHKCKGLEFPVVYCPFLWGGDQGGRSLAPPLAFHDPSAGNRITLDLGSEDLAGSTRRARWESLAEGLRLAYVGLTRARHRCTVFWGPWRGVQESALGYLLHQGGLGAEAGGPEELWERVSERIGGLDEEDLKRDLVELAEGSGGAILVR
ncbi:MAG: UvrD-helicase domain-containing protein, partial [Polyangia bacterium]|nr:UvrD-helicase domain-containing protein [Polyangia bacterium]